MVTSDVLGRRGHEQRAEYLPSVSSQPKDQILARREDRLISACRRIFLNFAKLRKTKSVEFIGVQIDPFICMSGTRGDGDDRACGNRHTVGKCERAQHETVHGDWEEAESGSVSRTCGAEEGIQRTGGYTIKPLGLPQKSVYLVHLVYPSLRPALFSDNSIDLFAEGFEIFRIGKEAVQDLCDSLLACND